MVNRIKNIFTKHNREDTKGAPEVVYSQKKGQISTVVPPLVISRQLIAGYGQSVGLHREHNEDSLFCSSQIFVDSKKCNISGLYIIADGMGGHRNGEVASSVTCLEISKYLIRELARLSTTSEGMSISQIEEYVQNSIAEAQKSVLLNAPGGGTTVTLALWRDEQVTIGQVGDSRAYLIQSEGTLERLTRDHSLVQRLIDLHEISESEAESHPQKNVLLRAIGQPEPFKADVNTINIPAGARLLLCSDGLWGVVDQESILGIVQGESNPVKACAELVAAANHNGGPDNISVIIVGLEG